MHWPPFSAEDSQANCRTRRHHLVFSPAPTASWTWSCHTTRNGVHRALAENPLHLVYGLPTRTLLEEEHMLWCSPQPRRSVGHFAVPNGYTDTHNPCVCIIVTLLTDPATIRLGYLHRGDTANALLRLDYLQLQYVIRHRCISVKIERMALWSKYTWAQRMHRRKFCGCIRFVSSRNVHFAANLHPQLDETVQFLIVFDPIIAVL